jgi:CHAT domain-containing protein
MTFMPEPFNDDEAGEQSILAVLRREARRGAYAAAGAWADGLPADLRGRPGVAVERARLRMRQGRMLLARAALAEARTDGEGGVADVLVALEGASLHIFQDADFARALAESDTALTRAGALCEVDAAEVRRIHARNWLMAATHHALPPDSARAAREQLAAAAQVLERAGRADDAFGAWLTLAGVAAGEERVRLLDALADRAARGGAPHLAAEARVHRAGYRLRLGDPDDAIHAELDAAEALFAATDHVYGAIDVRRARAQLAVERHGAGTEALEECLRAYLEADLPRPVFAVLMDLSQLAHERGDPLFAEALRLLGLEIAKEAGMGLAQHQLVLSEAGERERAGDYEGAIEVCERELAGALPPIYAATLEQQLVTACFLVGDEEQTLRHARSAMARYEVLGAEDFGSLAAQQVAVALSALPGAAAWDEAESILRAHMAADRRRGDFASAVSKRDALINLLLQRFYKSPVQAGDPRLLAAVARELARGEALVRYLRGTEHARYAGNLHQQRARLCLARGDEEGMVRAWQDAQALFEGAGLAMEAANCRYLLGTFFLNRANEDLAAWFGPAEESLQYALDYYAGAGMRTHAADTRRMIARLYSNAAIFVDPPVRDQLRESAFTHLAAADDDELRCELAVGGALQAPLGNHAVANSSRSILDLGLQLLLFSRGDVDEAWQWAQRTKARTLTNALAARWRHASVKNVPMLEYESHRLQASTDADLRLRELRDLRSGAVVEASALIIMAADESGPATVFVDWITVGTQLILMARRADAPTHIANLPVDMEQVRALVAANLAPHSFRDTLRDNPYILNELNGIVQPLEGLAAPGERLVLCPTGPLHAVPLHALTVAGEPLLARHPVVYAPSLTVLRHCLARRYPRDAVPTAALLGNPGGDRGEAGELVRELGLRFGAVPLLEGDVTRAAFAAAAESAGLIHFQGHARHNRADPFASHLMLADGPMTARDVFGLERFRAELVVLAACESAVNVVRTGDEPLGLIPAFLFAGAQSVLATLWPVHQSSAALGMRYFYNALDEGLDRAQALRRAMLALRADPRFSTPYHWAPFVLHGAWS